MTPRPRKSGRKGWPDNLYVDRKGGRDYYRYRHPVTGKKHSLGSDYGKAVQAARVLNNRLIPAVGIESLVSAVVAGETTLFSKWLERFADEILPVHRDKGGSGYAPRTLEDYQRRARKIAAEKWAAKAVADITVRDVAQYLDSKPARSGNVDRALLDMSFRHAKAKGLCEHNPAADTLAKAAKKERQRLDKAAFDAIHAAAEPWFKRALDLALVTLQRREDLTRMRFADERDGHLYVSQGKVEKHGTGHVRLKIGPRLRATIDACRDDIACPFMIHRRPEKMRREYLDEKEHWAQVTPELLTRTFKELRDGLKLHDDLAPNQRPTFHEIRSLGGHLYREQGWSEAEIQAIYSHTTEGMTEHYLEGHGVRWVDARGM
jgi:enterobacteria phage integrase